MKYLISGDDTMASINFKTRLSFPGAKITSVCLLRKSDGGNKFSNWKKIMAEISGISIFDTKKTRK